MNPEIFAIMSSAANQAAWGNGLRFEGLTFDYVKYEWTIRIEGKEFILLPADVFSRQNLVPSLIQLIRATPFRQAKGLLPS